MSKKLTGNKNQKIPVGEIEGCFLIVNFDYGIITHPPAIEYCHGEHIINQDEVNFNINWVQFKINDVVIFSKNKRELNPAQLLALESLLTIND